MGFGSLVVMLTFPVTKALNLLWLPVAVLLRGAWLFFVFILLTGSLR